MLWTLFLIIFLTEIHADVDGSSPEVIIKQGSLKGHRIVSRQGRDILAFQRIPYAKSPTGYLRFKSPQPPEKWSGVLDATQSVPKCVQRNTYRKEKTPSGQEDCLFINVYTPHTTGHHLLDVMIYIHGGGWLAGEGVMHGPGYLLDKDIVLVTFNYRLGALGFLSTGDDVCPGNNGLKDQVAALKWVQENIAAFGGNPGSVTIFGDSAGGASVHYLMLSPSSRGLFHRGISQSGTAFCSWSLSPHGSGTHQAKKLAALLDCPIENSTELVSCLRTKDAMEIAATDSAFMEWSLDPVIPFKPVVETGEDAFITAPPLEMLQNYTHTVPWMTGINSEEGAFTASRLYGEERIPDFDERFEYVAPIALFYSETSPRKVEISRIIKKFYFRDEPISTENVTGVVDLFTDGWFLHGADQAVRLHSAINSSPVYYYYFTYRGSKSLSGIFGDTTRDYGVCHADDLLYLFPFKEIFSESKPTEDDEKMVDIMITLWTNFARIGNPTPTPFKGVQWPKVSTPDNAEYLQIDVDGLEVKRGLLKERAQLWDSLPFDSPIPDEHKDEL